MTKLTTPSVLAFESKLACSDALMFAGNWQQRDNVGSWQPVPVFEKSVRGTISNRIKGAKASKIDAEVEKANPQTVDNAALPFDADTLKLQFTLRVLGDLSTPSTCNNPDYQTALASVICHYVESNGFKTIAHRYATNLANGRFLWRNRVGAEAVEVRISHEEKQWVFDAHELSLKAFDAKNKGLTEITAVIEQGLMGEKATLLKVEAFSQLGDGQTVFPSQELVMNSGSGDKSKYLYQLNGQAAMHSQKVGNALRTIDTWYPQADEFGPIAIEPYGSVTNRGVAYRKPKAKTDFYNLLDSWLLKDKAPGLDQQHYVIAMLIRGGVFGE
ncbi:type I-F CRISPR-associated protein Csy3 [Photobacterium lutimaris]|uniref:Type I-F CRISPR-associated protein Csy3 n=1 Tax=Photobacterium lutimaris TaxID=388278 RepID=A0A2T3J4S0_9GAMM|nr:type I-F CRISPR-associated protein Csy3 [Photobacterium lutimaris]PSU36288.1 type I-F CRISPR-associated protein Csy3 [Photobacterium lutimaris]TDR74828.1 CRISPR-associated Csy3 family protein [Photobacterium lutimaris]